MKRAETKHINDPRLSQSARKIRDAVPEKTPAVNSMLDRPKTIKRYAMDHEEIQMGTVPMLGREIRNEARMKSDTRP